MTMAPPAADDRKIKPPVPRRPSERVRAQARALRERFLFNRELRLRIASAAILIPLALASTYLGETWFALFVLLGAALVMVEWLRMIGAGELYHLHAAGWALLAGLAAIAVFAPLYVALPAVGVAAVLLALAAWRDRSDVAARWVLSGGVYVGLAVIALVALRKGPDGFGAIVFVFLTGWASDTTAFFVGRRLRGPKLWPRVSPSKTWSGALGGFAAAVVLGTLVAAAFGAPITVATLLLAAVVGLSAQLGDLIESALKRAFMIKDAGTLIPGHGGVMDRVDGIAAAALAMALIGATVSASAPATGLFALMGR